MGRFRLVSAGYTIIFFPRRADPAELSRRFLMLMNAFDKLVQSNTEQTGRGHGFARMFDRVCAFLDERVGGASALVSACQSVADRFWHSKLYFPVCFLMLAVFMAA